MITSLDLTLGLVGGVSAIIWGTLMFAIGGYESFKFENSLISAIYPTSPQDSDPDGGDDGSPPTEQKAKHAMMRTVAERGRYWYTYSEYFLTWFLNSLCCCFCRRSSWFQRRIERLERHEAASEKLADEIDIVNLLHALRLGQFTAKLNLKKHQRALITSFKKYQIDDLGQSAAADASAEDDETSL